MAHELLYHPDVKKRDIPEIDRGLQKRIAAAIRERLVEAPERYGHPLRGTLKGYWKLRVGDYRVVYRISGSEVWILGIAHRRDVYAGIPRRLDWKPERLAGPTGQ